MRWVPVVVVSALLLATSGSPVAADETKSIRGTVQAIGADSITLKTAEGEKVIKVAHETEVIARGGSTAMRAALKQGQEGVKLADVLKVGDNVEIKYKEMDGAMHATQIRGGLGSGGGAVATAGSMPAKPMEQKVTGKITNVGGDSITLNAQGKDWTFKIDKSTYVVGKGATTRTLALEREGKPTTIDQFLHANDEVQVEYIDMSGTMMAKEIRVLTPAR